MMQEDNDIAAYQAALLAIQEAAKQSGILVPLLQTAYFAVISMSDLKKAIWGNWGWAVLFVVPALLWLGSLVLAIRVFVPPLVSMEAQGPATYERVVQNKYRLLRFSQYTLAAGLLVMIAIVIIYFVYIPPPSPSP